MSKNIHPYRGTLPTISDKAFIASNAIVIGDVEIGEGTSIWYNCVIRGDMDEIRIGKHTNIQDGTIVHVAAEQFGAYIGDEVTIGHMALIHACTLEDGCMVGMQATVMDGSVVESGAIVAAGFLVPPGKRIPANQMWAGSPARFVREVRESDRQMLDYIWPAYEKLSTEYIEAGLDIRNIDKQNTADGE